MKKVIAIVAIAINIIILSACQKIEMQTISFFEYMDTFIQIDMLTGEDELEKHEIEIENIFKTYHELSTSHQPLSETTNFLENIYSINRKNNQLLEIDPELFYLIQEAERIRKLTNGYFDISIGEAINVWKELILDESRGYLYDEISSDSFDAAIKEIEKIVIKEDVIELSKRDGKYFIHVKSDTAQLDLGAISKGYATQLVYNYIREKGIEYFSISAGTSTIAIGKNENRDEGIFHVSLANPVRTSSDDRTYGMIFVKNIGVTTAGNFLQYATYENDRYHHIVSPKTKMPMQYYHTVTLIGNNLGVLDAISTALFSMSPTVFDEWVEANMEELEFEAIRFNSDLTITTYLTETKFKENE